MIAWGAWAHAYALVRPDGYIGFTTSEDTTDGLVALDTLLRSQFSVQE